jgi:hypothetical protein
MTGLDAGPHRLAHLPGAQRHPGIGQHLHHVPVGHRQSPPVPILTEGGNLPSHPRPFRRRRLAGLGIGIGNDRIPAGQGILGQYLDHGPPGDLQPPQQRLLGGQLLGQPVHLARNPSTRARAARSRASNVSSNDPTTASSRTRRRRSSPPRTDPPNLQLTGSLQRSRTLL